MLTVVNDDASPRDRSLVADGYRESSEARAGLLRDCARRGMRAPVLAVGDAAPGFWKAPGEVFPETRPQRYWVRKTASVTGSMPKSAQAAAKKAPQDSCNAEDREHAEQAIAVFTKLCPARLPKAVAKGAGSRAAGLAMVFKLVESAQARWRAVNGAHLVPLVRAGARFERGLLVEREELAA
jgi:putative transposase